MKKLLFIHHGKIPGGAPNSLQYTINGLRSFTDKYEITIVVSNDEMKSYFEIRCPNVTVVNFKDSLMEIGKIIIGWTPFLYWKSIKELFRNVRYIKARIFDFEQLFIKEKPDLIHLNSATLFVPALAAKRLNIPVIMHVREVFGGRKWNIRRIIVGKWYQKLVNHLITISDIEKWSISGENSSKVTTIYNFVDFQSFKPSISRSVLRKKLSIKEDVNVLITLGGVAPRKGFVELIRALSLLPKERFHLLVAGPPLEAGNNSVTNFDKLLFLIEDILTVIRLRSFKFVRYQKRSLYVFNKLKNRINITFLGNVKNVPDYLSCADALVFLGTTPHFPRPIYESWLLNKPVVVSNVIGILEHVTVGKDGLIADYRSTQDIAQKLKDVSVGIRNVAEFGKKKSLKLFNQTTNVNKIDQLFEKIIQESIKK